MDEREHGGLPNTVNLRRIIGTAFAERCAYALQVLKATNGPICASAGFLGRGRENPDILYRH
jgi:hypothetical protein